MSTCLLLVLLTYLQYWDLKKLIDRFECTDVKSFRELENKVLELKLNKKYGQSEKLKLF